MMLATLSPRELDVLRLCAAGLNQAQVADALGIAHCTVKTRAKFVFAKLGARSMPHAVALGHQRGLLPVPAEAAA
jgi:DNA-binding NarL/FixJ family response regulator